jgi:tetratricopeptide (TPR) repeat protein
MKKTLRAAAVAVILLPVALTFTGCNKLRARDQLNKGVQAYKSMHYEQAIENFKNAASLDPSLPLARLYLATAYANSYVQGVDTPENNQFAEQAIDNFKQVIDSNPPPPKATKIASLKGIASILFNQATALVNEKNFSAGAAKLEQAKDYKKKIIAEQPDDAEAHYSIGVIDWTLTYKPRMDMRAQLHLTDASQPIKDQKVCQDLKAKNEPIVTEGIDELQKAMDARKDYDDAMAYMNLMYREKADIECGDPATRQADLKEADGWVQKTMDTKKAKAEKQSQQGGIVLDQPANK